VAAKPFWALRHNLAEAEGLLLNGSRLVVPVSLRQEVMAGFHDGHFGEVKCTTTKSGIWWSGPLRNKRIVIEIHPSRFVPSSCQSTLSSGC